MRKLIVVAGMLLVCACLMATGCKRSAPITNPGSAVPTHNQLTLTQVRDAIITAGTRNGWEMREDGIGKVIATYARRTHQAVVSIPYDETNFHINYESSVNLRAQDGTIHPNYNRWVNNLKQQIMTELTLIRNN